MSRHLPLWLSLLAVLAGCASPTPDVLPETAASPQVPQDLHAQVNGASLQYLDWGGAGDLMLFLPGLTQTAHTFAGVAPAFTDEFRAMGVTLRGHGASAKPSGPYDATTLVDDVVAFIDAVGGDRVVLVGHSFSGVLLPDIARRLDDRVRALIFLDAVYDWPTLWEVPWPGPSPPDSARESYDALDRWWREHYPDTWGPIFQLMLRAQTYLGSDGRLRDQLRDGDRQRFVEISRRGPSFDGLRPPLLIILSDDSFVEYGAPAPEADAMRAWSREFHVPNKRRGVEALTDVAPGATVLEIRAPHAAYLFAPDEIVRMMREFLGSLRGP